MGAHLDLLHVPEQLLHLVLQPLESLLRRLLGTKTLTQLWEKWVRGLMGARGLTLGQGSSWDVGRVTVVQGSHRGSGGSQVLAAPGTEQEEQVRPAGTGQSSLRGHLKGT